MGDTINYIKQQFATKSHFFVNLLCVMGVCGQTISFALNTRQVTQWLTIKREYNYISEKKK